MARTNHALLQQLSGALGKQLVFKKYGDKTVISKFPDMSGVKPGRRQLPGQKRFAPAVAYAKAINRNPLQKAVYSKKVKKGQSVYHYALKEYFDKHAL